MLNIIKWNLPTDTTMQQDVTWVTAAGSGLTLALSTEAPELQKCIHTLNKSLSSSSSFRILLSHVLLLYNQKLYFYFYFLFCKSYHCLQFLYWTKPLMGPSMEFTIKIVPLTLSIKWTLHKLDFLHEKGLSIKYSLNTEMWLDLVILIFSGGVLSFSPMTVKLKRLNI